MSINIPCNLQSSTILLKGGAISFSAKEQILALKNKYEGLEIFLQWIILLG